jgi:hypothetical protein
MITKAVQINEVLISQYLDLNRTLQAIDCPKTPISYHLADILLAKILYRDEFDANERLKDLKFTKGQSYDALNKLWYRSINDARATEEAPHFTPFEKLMEILISAHEFPEYASRTYRELQDKDFFTENGVYIRATNCWFSSRALQNENGISLRSRDQLLSILVEQVIDPVQAKKHLKQFLESDLYLRSSELCIYETALSNRPWLEAQASILDQQLLILAQTNFGQESKKLTKLKATNSFLNNQTHFSDELDTDFMEDNQDQKDQLLIQYFDLLMEIRSARS